MVFGCVWRERPGLARPRGLKAINQPSLPIVSVCPHVLLKHAHDAKTALHGPFLLLQVALATLGCVVMANPEVMRAVQLDEHLEAVRERQVKVEVGRTWSAVTCLAMGVEGLKGVVPLLFA